MHDPRIGRFFAIDPMASSYPHNSPYAFSENRVIDGVELEGLEWDKATDGNGNTTISVNVSFDVGENLDENKPLNLSDGQISEYQSAISSELNRVLNSASGGTYSGIVTFNGGEQTGQVIPTVSLYGKTDIVGGFTMNADVSLNVISNKDGSLRTPEEVAKDAVHELLHTLRLEHPFELTQTSDTKLIKAPGANRYYSTPETDPSITNNIMNYSQIFVDGLNLRGCLQKQSTITSGQIEFLLKEIGLQQSGYGIKPERDSYKTQEEYESDYMKKKMDYWFFAPGEVVK